MVDPRQSKKNEKDDKKDKDKQDKKDQDKKDKKDKKDESKQTSAFPNLAAQKTMQAAKQQKTQLEGDIAEKEQETEKKVEDEGLKEQAETEYREVAPRGDPIISRDKEGEITAVELPDGRIFAKGGGMSSKDLKAMAEAGAHRETPRGAVEKQQLEQQAKQKRQQAKQRMQELGYEKFNKEDVNKFIERVQAHKEQLDPLSVKMDAERRAQRLKAEGEEQVGGFAEEVFEPGSALQSVGKALGGSTWRNIATAAGFGGDSKPPKEFNQLSQLSQTDEGKALGITQENVVKNGIQQKNSEFWDRKLTNQMRLWGDFDIFGLSSENLVDYLTEREKPSELEGAVGKIGESVTAIRGQVQAQGLSGSEGMAKIDQVEDGMNTLKRRIKQAIELNPTVKESGEAAAILAEVDKVEMELAESRADILEATRKQDKEFNALETRRILQKLKES